MKGIMYSKPEPCIALKGLFHNSDSLAVHYPAYYMAP